MTRFVALLFMLFVSNFADEKGVGILSTPEILARGHKYAAWFYSDGLDSLLQCVVDKKQGIQNVRESRRRVESQFGRETEVLNELTGKSILNSHRYYYVRHSRFSKAKQPVKMESSFDSADNIFQFSVEMLPGEAPTRFLNYRTKTELRLPFNGQWYVAAGGLNIYANHHAVSTDQRFAYDFLIKKDGFTFQIVIDHGNGEFSILAHLKRGSIAVKAGDTVEIGQFLGLCGNSGHAAQAHLHYHLQNSPVIFAGEGLPIQFQSYVADGREIEKGAPLWSQCVMNY